MTQITQHNDYWRLSGNVVMASVSAIFATSKSFKMDASTTVDFADVQDIDTATISLILEWQRRAARENTKLNLINLPVNLVNLAQLYGVEDFMH